MTDRICSIEGCEKPHYGRGWCSTHYQRWRKTGTTDNPDNTERLCSLDGCDRKHKGRGLCAPHLRAKKLRDAETVCSVEGCETAIIAKGMCGKHYQRVKTKGSTDDPIRYTPEERRQAFRDATRRHYQRHRERVRAAKRARYWLDPKAENERARRWREANPERVAELNRAWRAANRERHAELCRDWRKANPERMRSIWMAKRARRLGQIKATDDGTVDYKAILAEYGMVCHICTGYIASLDDLHFDHVIPLARGGPHSADNVRPSHATCNMRKSDKLMSELTFIKP